MGRENIVFEWNRYSVKIDDDKIRVMYCEEGREKRTAMVLRKGFAISRKASLKTKPVNGMANLKHRVKRESRSLSEYTVLVIPNGVELSGKLDSGKIWVFSVVEKPQGLWFSLRCSGADETGLSFESAQDEGFMGFGEQFTHLDMSGKAFSLCVSEKGIGRGAQPLSTLVGLVSRGAAGNDYTTYAPMPVFITTNGRAMCFERDTVYWCDIRNRNNNEAVFTAWGEELSGWLFCADTPIGLIESHTAVTGRVKPLPEYAYGTILGVRGGRVFAEEVLDNCLRHNAPITALWVEDWQGRRGKKGGPPLWWRWYPDESTYPGFKEWADSLKERGIALLGYANTFLSADDVNNHLYTEGRERGFFVKNSDGTDYVSHFFTGREYKYVIVDITNPDAYDWLKEKMRIGMIENGLSGWMADYGEYLPMDCVTFSGNSVEAHCAFPTLWAKLNAELIEETGNRGEILTFHRSGGVSSNGYATLYWAGDQSPTFDEHNGLASSITALITGGISGMSINHTDIGGFTTLKTPIYKIVRKKELLLRWLEYAAFTPIFRTHDGGSASSLNYRFYFDEEGYAAFARFGRVHASIKWYILELENEAVEKGLPMTRALYLHYPDDRVCRGIRYQFLLGEDILVNPVCEFGAGYVKAYLPAGNWLCSHTEKAYDGGHYENLPAPLGSPAVLVRAESPRAQKLLETLRVGFETKD
jgi:alpha-glucosidase